MGAAGRITRTSSAKESMRDRDPTAGLTPSVRALRRGDIGYVAEMFAQDMKKLGTNTPVARIERMMERVLEDEQKTCACWVVAYEGHADLGGVVLVDFYHSLKFGGRSLWIEGLYVKPEARRRGIGGLLVEHIVDWAEENGFLGLDLEAYHGNTPAAVLYRSHGFSRLGRERFSLSFEDLEG